MDQAAKQSVFALHQLPDFLERLVERAAGNVCVDGVDRRDSYCVDPATHSSTDIGIAPLRGEQTRVAPMRWPISKEKAAGFPPPP
jgi:hypothetical protein